MSSLGRLVRDAAIHAGLSEAYFRYLGWRRSRSRERPPAADADGVPIPPLEMMVRVVAHADWREFLRGGGEAAGAIAARAEEAGVDFRNANRVLDLGCGCGRVIRHMPKHTRAALFGVDCNPSLVRWCARNLAGDFRKNELRPPLDYPDGYFDAVYLVSVFTHLRIPTQREWLAELHRILRPGGTALVTFHGEDQPGLPDTDEARATLRRDGFFIYNDRVEGSNFIAMFQTRDFTRALFGECFEIVRIVPCAETQIGQTLAVLRKS